MYKSSGKKGPILKFSKIGLVALFIMILMVGCSSSEEHAQFEKISADDALDLMVDGNIILDVRTPEEFESGHVKGAINLPLDQIENGDFGMLEDKAQIILVYCRSGNRSNQASQILADEGYTKIYDFGGITDWPYEVEK